MVCSKSITCIPSLIPNKKDAVLGFHLLVLWPKWILDNTKCLIRNMIFFFCSCLPVLLAVATAIAADACCRISETMPVTQKAVKYTHVYKQQLCGTREKIEKETESLAWYRYCLYKTTTKCLLQTNRGRKAIHRHVKEEFIYNARLGLGLCKGTQPNPCSAKLR